ncbi:MAG: FAD-binding protein [Acidobacteria bacterium]|nr:FAD-binding protein [Acidobacteriota bacterium]
MFPVPLPERRDLTPEEVAAITRILGDDSVVVAKDDLQPYAHDWTEDFVLYPALAARPRSTAEVARLVAYCNERRIPVTPQGGRTCLTGGAIPLAGGVALSLERMNRILEIDASNLVAIVEPGVITQTLHEAVEELGLYYPPDPASRGSCTLGGNLAENAGGPHSAKYGVTGKWVLGLEAVMADGSVMTTGGKTRKDVAGYDLTALLVGSEGTLAVITKAWLRLIPKPKVSATLLAPFPTLESAARCVAEIHRQGLVPSACEFVDKPCVDVSSKRKGVAVPFPDAEARLLFDFDGAEDAEVERDLVRAGEIATACGALEVLLATDEARRRVLWDVRRGIGEAVRDLGPSAELDLGVPRTEFVPLVSALRRIAGEWGFGAVAFGHAADGNLHVHLYREGGGSVDAGRFAEAIAAIYAETARLGGTVAAEHGVGFTSREHLHLCRPPAYRAALLAIKRALDPNGILNPGKVLTS